MASKPDDTPLDEGELEALLFYACSSGTPTREFTRSMIRRAVFELMGRRRAELSSFNKMQLSVLRDRLGDYTEDVSMKELLTKIIGDEHPPSIILSPEVESVCKAAAAAPADEFSQAFPPKKEP